MSFTVITFDTRGLSRDEKEVSRVTVNTVAKACVIIRGRRPWQRTVTFCVERPLTDRERWYLAEARTRSDKEWRELDPFEIDQ